MEDSEAQSMETGESSDKGTLMPTPTQGSKLRERSTIQPPVRYQAQSAEAVEHFGVML